ncbi:MAG: D-TA family PLP-dependent enzyme [Lachnospiraceae bacterium]|nr:D-TA family PLP-dependent enzyme [Lachnospiraceae bacterium]
MRYLELDTPSLLIDRERLLKNLADMQHYADENGVRLRPHTKTHKMPEVAKWQEEQGACGIAVAKVGEAEVMAKAGLRDIFIANEIVGARKLERIAALAKNGIRISFGVDSPCQVAQAETAFAAAGTTVSVLVEIEVGENRSGIIREEDFFRLLETVKGCPHVSFAGIFSHDGNSYHAADLAELHEIAEGAQRRTLHFAGLAKERGMPCRVVSYGATPTFMNHVKILEGITELRPGTYALMDASQGHAIGTLDRCAATVLATVISKPTDTRTILDAGAKGLTMQERTAGICATPGKGTILEHPETHIDSVFDEHAILYDKEFHDRMGIGDKVRVIPVHICPVCNLYDRAYLISDGEVIQELEIACRGRLQ